MLAINAIHVMDCLAGAQQLPSECVQCCVTSPPYFQQRDYGVDGQLGMEASPELYVAALVNLFREIKRILKPDGTLWLNLGDSYWGSGKAGNNPEYQKKHTEFGKPSKEKSRFGKPTTGKHPSIKNKDLIGIPWAVAFALRYDGWYLRQEIIWAKTNGMPESARDRCTRNHEQIFMFSKQSQYYYDANAIKTPLKEISKLRMSRAVSQNHKYAKGSPGKKAQTICTSRGASHKIIPADNISPLESSVDHPSFWANRRSVWSFSPKGIRDKHFASFPIELPTTCILAGSSPGDLVLDPFMGSGTTAIAAANLKRRYIGFELNPEYAQIASDRLVRDLGMFMPTPISDWY